MALRDCAVIAMEGTHASGKTTLVHALTAAYRQRGVHVACTDEVARTSPFIEEIVIHNRGTFDLATEVDLFAAQLTSQLRASRHHALLICDKTVVNVLAYARLVLEATPGSQDAAVVEAMEGFCRAWTPTYDAVFYCPDHYAADQGGDPFRAKVVDLQEATDRMLRNTCAAAGISLIELPAQLTVDERTHWVMATVDSLGLGPIG
jgi:predicted ATPase